jgi:DNA-binding response OmpR family regulator
MFFKKEKILVCDDQPMLRSLLANAIRDFSAKYEVVEAQNGAIAEQLLRTEKFSAIFMDVEMPEQDGFTTLEKIRAEDLANGAPVVMCTGCSEEEHLVRGWQLEADFYLTKPFDLDEVDSLLEEIDQQINSVAQV